MRTALPQNFVCRGAKQETYSSSSVAQWRRRTAGAWLAAGVLERAREWRAFRLMNATDRRGFLRLIGAGAALPLVACSSYRHAGPPCDGTLAGFTPVTGLPRTLQTGDASHPPVVLLHELPGLTPADLALGYCLAGRELHVYVPVLFGEPGQDNGILGYFQSCATREFECSKLSTSSSVLDRIEQVVEHAHKVAGRGVGVIGMCLTGIFPLALLRNRHVRAAVVCQPTLPFSLLARGPAGAQIDNLGLGQDDLVAALRSDVSFLAVRYAQDRLCPEGRMKKIETTFGDRVAVIRIPTDAPKRHSTLAADYDPTAFDDTVRYLKVRLGAEAGPKDMRLAKLGGTSVSIDADGRWRPQRSGRGHTGMV
jgi:dienelactone hydrolase